MGSVWLQFGPLTVAKMLADSGKITIGWGNNNGDA